MDERLRRAPVGVVEVSADATVKDLNHKASELLGAGSDATGVPIEDVFPRSVEDSVVSTFQATEITEVDFEEFYPEIERWLAVSVVPTDERVTIFVEDVTRRHRHERSLERLRDERQRIAVIDDVLSQVLGELVGATSRDEIAETVCRELGETDRYEFAWVGEREVGSDNLVVRAVAGDAGETFSAVRDALNEMSTPEERAVESGTLQAIQPLADDPQVPKAIRMAGFADGIQSVLAIPLVYGSNVHGVVGVYADRKEGFSEREQRSFETLGEMAGFAVTAARNRNLLFSDSVTEVTFSVGSNSVLGWLSGTLETNLSLQGLVPHGDDALVCFVTVEADEVEQIGTAVGETETVDEFRVIDDSGDGVTVELRVHKPTPLLAISTLGGSVREATFTEGTGQVVVDLPPDGNLRRMAETVSREYDAEIVAKRERERPVTTAREFSETLEERLTERQQTVLRTAYLADYFESPRGSTAEEVASTLDITGSTLLHHLRASQRKLLDSFFGDSTSTPD